MSTDLVRYDLLVQEALKSVVRRVLSDAARDGLPGEHHFYISFRTDHPAAKVSQRLREKYPQEMTIVLQHQFDNLIIQESGFEVGLSFSGFPERLRVPFDALTGFFDPSVQFGLKFETSEEQGGEDIASETETSADAIPLAPKRSGVPAVKEPKLGSRKKADTAAKEKPAVDTADDESGGTAEVVSLDSFRKKS